MGVNAMLTAVAMIVAAQAVSAGDIVKGRQLAASSSWETCARAEGRRLAGGTREPAATIADGALGLCADHQREFQMWTGRIVAAMNDSSAFVARVTADRREEIRGLVIATVLDLRAGRKAPAR